MNSDNKDQSDKSFTIEDLRRALNDAQLREDIRSLYAVEAQDNDVVDRPSLKDQAGHRKEAIFNSW